MNIIETNLNFGNLTKCSRTVRAILHHSAGSKASAEDIHRWHLANGWAGAGYHFLVRKDGSVYRLRPEWAVGAHASGSNSDSIGICFEGNFMTETMPTAQKQAGKELVAWVKKKYGFTKVQAHRDVQATGCPGTNFPFAEIANGSTGTVTPTPPTSGNTYTVQKGDTLTAIAKKYNTTVDALAKASGITDPNKIQVGQTIVIPGTAEEPDSDDIAEDGIWSVKTTKKAQQVFGTGSDGIISNQLSCYQANCKGIVNTIQWSNTKRGGSLLIKAIQRHIGETPDGYLGPGTIRGIQRWQGCAADGVFSYPSPSIKAFQHWLNQQ